MEEYIHLKEEENIVGEDGAERRAVRRGTELERSRNVIISVVNLTHSMEWVPTTTTTTTTMI